MAGHYIHVPPSCMLSGQAQPIQSVLSRRAGSRVVGQLVSSSERAEACYFSCIGMPTSPSFPPQSLFLIPESAHARTSFVDPAVVGCPHIIAQTGTTGTVGKPSTGRQGMNPCSSSATHIQETILSSADPRFQRRKAEQHRDGALNLH